MPAHRATKIQNTQATANNTFLWQEAIDQAVGRPPHWWSLYCRSQQVIAVGPAPCSKYQLYQAQPILPLMRLWMQEMGPNGNTSSIQRRCTEKLQPLMSDKDVDTVQLEDHQE